MKTFSCIILCSLLIVGSMIFADERAYLYGWVFDEETPVAGAKVSRWDYPGGGNLEYAYTDSSGYYYISTFAGTYCMEAVKGSKNDLQFPIYYNGGVGGKQVDFHLTYDVK